MKLKRLISFLLTVIMMCSLCTGMSLAAFAEENNAIIEARNGVVRILVYGYGTLSNGSKGYFIASGTGFAIGKAGEPSAIFVTNKHVIEDALSIYILLDDEWYEEWIAGMTSGKLDTEMEHAVKCEVVYTPDVAPDFAILRAERVVTERVALPLMSAEMAKPTENIYVLGFPGFGDTVVHGYNPSLDQKPASIDSMVITKGTISRFTTVGDEMNTEAIQVDAATGPGNSGSPLMTEDGYVIGLHTWGYSDGKQEMNVSVKIDYVIDRLKNLRETGVLPNFEPTVITERNPASQETPVLQTDTPAPVIEKEKEGLDTWVIVLIFLASFTVLGTVIFVVLKKYPIPQKTAPAAAPTAQPVTPGAPAVEAFPKTMPATDMIPKTMPAVGVDIHRLAGEGGFFAGRRFAVDRPLKLGRDPQKNDLVFAPNTAGVSGTHCILTPVADGVSITDLGSSYGTFLSNGTKLAPNQSVTLKPGEGFWLGSRDQSFRIEKKEK